MRAVILKVLFPVVLVSILLSSPVLAQKSGQSAKISMGTVVQTERVNMQSDAAKAAIAGGIIGYHATSSSKSKSRKRKNAALGATALGATMRAGEGDLTGAMYTVQMMDGSQMKVVSDQTQIVQGDCVTIEQVRDNANIRRVDPVLCEPASQEDLLSDVQAELQEEADECYAAKQELLNADSDEAVERSARKIKILCNN